MYTNFEFSRILVGVGGGSASGKTTLCRTISNEMKVDKQFNVLILSLDSFQWGIRDWVGDIKDFNFDDPLTIDWDLALSTLQRLISGESVTIPEYDFVAHQRHPPEQWTSVEAHDIIFLEGIFALWDERIRALMNYQIFIHCDDDIKLCRRILRDTAERGRDLESVLYQYNRFVKPSFQVWIQPQMKHADIIVPGYKNNKIAVNLIVHQLKNQNRELTILKNRMSNQLLFYGDLLHDLQILVGFSSPLLNKEEDNLLSMVDDQLQRRVFFINDRQSQKELMVYVRYLVIGEKFTSSHYKHTLKTLLKYSFTLFTNALQLKNIDKDTIQAISINILQQQPQHYVTYQASDRPYAVVVVPFLAGQEGEQLLTTILEVFALRQQKVIIFNFFGHIQNIMDVTKIKQDSFCCIINSFMIATIDKFYRQFEQVQDTKEVSSNYFMAEALTKHLTKRLAKQHIQ